MFRKLSGILFLGLALAGTVFAQVNPAGLGKMAGLEQKPDGVVISFSNGIVKLSELTPEIVRVRATRKKEFAPDFSFALVSGGPRPGPIKTEDAKSWLILKTDKLQIRIGKDPGRFEIFDRSGNLLFAEPESGGIFFEDGKPGIVRLIQPGEHFYGFGEKTGPFDKLGQRMVMWNTDHSYDVDDDPIYQSHPYYLSLRKGIAYGIFLDNSYRSEFNLGATDPGKFSYQADGGELNYYIIAGPEPMQVIERYSSLVGRYPLPPLWALGYQQCRWSYKNEGIVRRLAKKFRTLRVPCDVIFLDIHYLDGYKVFTFHPKRFPDPQKLISDLKKDGFRIITIVDPGVKIEPGYPVFDQGMEKNYFVHSAQGGYFTANVWPGAVYYPDFYQANVREWWGGLQKFLTDLGIAGIWNDMNEPAGWSKVRGGVNFLEMRHGPNGEIEHALAHNAYGSLMTQASFEGLKTLRPEERPFVISRGGYSGIQKYACVWTGDNTSNWDQLRLAPSMLLNLGISGVPMVGADIGGFGGHPSAEMYARWLQQGVFYPFSRTHTAQGTPSQDPFSFGKKVLDAGRLAIQVRYQLLPYFYSYMKEASENGRPLMRAMLLEFPEDEKTYQMTDQFMIGEWLLVAPVMEPKVASRKIYLPAGEWYQFETSGMIKGEKELEAAVGLDTIPIYVKAGAIIPLAPVMNYTGEKPWSPITLQFYPGSEKSCFDLYEDAGNGYGYLNGEYLLNHFCQQSETATLTITKAPAQGKMQSPSRELSFVIFTDQKPLKVELLKGKETQNLTYSFDSGRLNFILPDTRDQIQIKISR